MIPPTVIPLTTHPTATHPNATHPTAIRRAAARTATRLPVVFVALALPFVRPNILGESKLSVVGFALLVTAAVLSVLTRPTARARRADPAAALVACLGLGYLWLMIQAAGTDPGTLGGPAVQGLFLTVGSVLALTVVVRDPRTRLAVGRLFVGVVLALSASFVVTALLWAVAGVGTGAVAAIPIGTIAPQPVYVPFTPTESVQTVFGTEFPRFTGLGREPGWMAMYCASAYFMADMVGFRRRWVKPVLVAGLIGCISTAGFGVFVVAWAFHVFLRDRGTGISVGGYLRHLLGVAATAGAVWLAVTAPVLGLAAKTTQNATSLDERQAATAAGLRALLDHPLGGPATEVQGGVNLISTIAVDGLPFVLAVCAALLLPVLVRQVPARFSNAITVIVFLTLLTSQPARDSTWAFALVALAVALRSPDMEHLVPTLVPPGPPTTPAAEPSRRTGVHP